MGRYDNNWHNRADNRNRRSCQGRYDQWPEQYRDEWCDEYIYECDNQDDCDEDQLRCYYGQEQMDYGDYQCGNFEYDCDNEYQIECNCERCLGNRCRYCCVGPRGPRGYRGPRGPQGCPGPRGPRGEQGCQGPRGPWGPTGPMGPQGLQGVPGATGERGVQGPTGAQGVPGEVGPTGPQGIQGVPGATGERGIQGPTGAQGVPGEMGPTGAQGIQGLLGPTGPQGSQGTSGATGATGATGPVYIPIEAGMAREMTASSGKIVNPDENLLWDKEIHNLSNDIIYHEDTGEFVFLKAGHYYINYTISITPNALNADFGFNFVGLTPTIDGGGAGSNSGTPTSIIVAQGIVQADVGDIGVVKYFAPGANLIAQTPNQGYFTIFYIGA